jgi:electron transport complex protein RnfG
MADKKKKLPSTFLNMVLVLSVIALVSALALGFTYTSTKDAIAQVEVNRTIKALKLVLPEFDNDPNAEKYTLEDEEYAEMEFFPAKKDGKFIGTAVRTYSDNGFTERIWLMVGFTPDKKINAISVLKHKETPGLGSKMNDKKFKTQFYGKDPASFQLKVKKDGGQIDAISAATISSRAFCDATEKAFAALKEGKRAGADNSAEEKTENTGKPENTGKTENAPAENTEESPAPTSPKEKKDDSPEKPVKQEGGKQ